MQAWTIPTLRFPSDFSALLSRSTEKYRRTYVGETVHVWCVRLARENDFRTLMQHVVKLRLHASIYYVCITSKLLLSLRCLLPKPSPCINVLCEKNVCTQTHKIRHTHLHARYIGCFPHGFRQFCRRARQHRETLAVCMHPCPLPRKKSYIEQRCKRSHATYVRRM